jgi:hypothetical protein
MRVLTFVDLAVSYSARDVYSVRMNKMRNGAATIMLEIRTKRQQNESQRHKIRKLCAVLLSSGIHITI